MQQRRRTRIAGLVRRAATCYMTVKQSSLRAPTPLTTRPRSLPALVLALSVLGLSPAAALELVPGGYGRPALDAGAGAPLPGERLAIDRSEGPAGMSLGFTPRHAGGSVAGPDAEPGPRFGLAVREGGGTLERLGALTAPSTLHPAGREGDGAGLTVGGAMQWHDWTVGGGVGQADFLGADVDLVAATLGYGRVSAEIAYGQTSGHEAEEPGDVLMLSTDLAAAPWLTLESDLAVGSRPDVHREDQSVAVGRFGLRLNF